MKINIVIEDKGIENDFERVEEIAREMHDVLRGNKDYINNGVVLNYEPPSSTLVYADPEQSTLNLVVGLHDCVDKVDTMGIRIPKVIDNILNSLNELSNQETSDKKEE